MTTFNDIIRSQQLIELPIKGRAYTWSNMQIDPTTRKNLTSSIGFLHTSSACTRATTTTLQLKE